MTRKQSSREAWRKWQRLVSEQASRGQTITAFCRERGLGRQSFFAWRKRLSQAEPKKFLEVKVARRGCYWGGGYRRYNSPVMFRRTHQRAMDRAVRQQPSSSPHVRWTATSICTMHHA